MTEQGPIPIAVIGMACRLPGGSDSPEKLWDMLSEGRSGWREIPADRWNKDSFYHPDPEAKEAINVKGLYFLNQDINAFDARFFGVHPHEAHCLDPQQRILMETTYEAIENAGLTLQDLKGSDTSVHVGAYATDFERMGYKDVSRVPKLHMIGSGIAILSNRISYVFDLKGASSTTDTGCSGSMVALHQAVLGLRARESKMAIVAGTQLVLAPDQIIPMSMVGMTNPDGRCYVFDHRGSGYARGEGVVSFVLKRLDDAIRDGDNIHAVIRNSGLNQDGKTAGISLPNPVAQATLMRHVYKNAGLDPKDTGYVEAHGTGTQAGDSAEISSIAEVFNEKERNGDLYVGSIKSNIGHLEASSGVAGLMKAILILKNGMIPPNIDFEKPKPTLHLDERRISIATKLTPLPTTGTRRVSVNSFGYGGTNAHIILEEYSQGKETAKPEIKTNGNGVSNGHSKLEAVKETLPFPEVNGVNGHSKVEVESEIVPNGAHINGASANGSYTNGDHSNGVNGSYSNGSHTNGTHRNGTHANGFHTNGTHTNGSHTNGSHTNGSHTNGSHTNGSYTNGSTNGAVEITEKIENRSTDVKNPELFVLSARSEDSLQGMVENLQKWVSSHNDGGSYFHDLAYTLSNRRTAMQFRSSTAAASHADLITSLSQKPRITKTSNAFKSVFLFTGQGAQWYAMGKELTTSQDIFKKSMLKSDEILKGLGAEWSLIAELSKDKESSRIGQAELSQPSTTAIQIALVDFLQSFGASPDIVLGHSSGEIAAAYAAGILDQKTALEISYHRGFMSQAVKDVMASKGAMMAVGLGEDEVEPYISQTRSGLISVACVNSPVSTTISGDEAAIDELKVILDEASIFNRKLAIDTAYHSHHMQKVASKYLMSIAHIKAGNPSSSVKFYSSVSATEKTDDFNAQYWVDNLVSKVRFSNSLDLICRNELVSLEVGGGAPLNVLIEIGPHSALAGPVRQVIKGVEPIKFKYDYLATLVRDRNAIVALLETAGKLWEAGYPVSLEAAQTTDAQSKTPTLIGDLPPYSWDHSSSFMIESNASKAHRFRAHAPHDLLGLRVIGTTDHEPSWRNLIGIDNLPWLRDHVVDGFIIYPGAAYVTMVIEALRQISIDRQTPGVMSKIVFKNISFSKAIIIPERRPDGLTPDVEVLLTLRPDRHLTDRTWENFRILSLSAENDIWGEHCSGSVMIEWASKLDEVEGLREEEMFKLNQLSKLQHLKDACDSEYQGDELYKTFAANGNVFGPIFSNIKSAQIGDHVGVSQVTLPDVSQSMPKKYQSPHLIHPVSFDAISHLGMPLYQRSNGTGPVMPTGMDEVVIDCRLGNEPGTKWVVATTMHSQGHQAAILDTTVYETLEDGSLNPIIDIHGGSLRGIGDTKTDETTLPFHRKMSYNINWKPDVDFLPKHKFETISEGTEIAENKTVAEIKQLSQPVEPILVESEMALYELAASAYIRACLIKGTPLDESGMKPHLQKLLAWMKKYTGSERSQKILSSVSEEELESYLKKSRNAGVEGQMLARIGEHLPAILSGEADSLSVMLEDDLLTRFYSQGLIVPNYLQMQEYLKSLAFKHPHMNILEIGAGTGGATLPLIKALDREEGALFDRYMYTDISSGFFEQGRGLLKDWIDRIDFKTLDISKDPVQQGFSEGTYDLIIASNVLHATPMLDETVANTRKLLKPGGRLILIELTRLTAHINVIFGTLAGWWASEDGRADCPLLSKEKWDATLKKQGFDGLEVATPDHLGPTARSNMIVSKATVSAIAPRAEFPSVEIICQAQSPAYKSFASEISTHLKGIGFSVSVETWASKSISLDTIYIVLDDANHAVLVEPSEELFPQVVSLVTRAKNVLWLGCQESATEVKNPTKGLVTGLARVVRRENEGMRFVTLDVQQSITSPHTLLPIISEIIAKSFPTPIKAANSAEDEYSFHNDQLLIPRVGPDTKFDTWVRRSIYNQGLETGLFQQPQRPLKLEVETPGLLSSLRFVDDNLPSKELPPGELELEAKAHGVNFKDVFIAMGQMVPGVTMAGECAGIVRKVGSALTDKFKIGDRVCGIGAEPFSSHPRINGYFSYQLPDSMSYAVGASIPVIFTTAYHCVVEAAHLQAGQSILIHAASGGVGQAAILLAQNIGAKIFCTVGSTAKRQLLIDNFGIPPENIFSSRLRTFKQGVLRLTENKGVDCVLNSLSGEWLHDSFAVLAPLGTFVEIGKTDIYRKNQISMVPFDRNVTFAAVDLTVLARIKPEEMRERLGKVLSMFAEGVLRPVAPVKTFPMGEIEEAFRLIQSRKHTGKVVLVCDAETTVKLTLPRPIPLRLRRDATYVIAGGLGDLGRRSARFLAANGAGHVVTLSRRKLKEEAQLAFEKEMRALGAELHIMACDVNDRDLVLALAAECSAKFPPVKGIIHGGMVLRDHPFEQMPLDDYMTAVKPKIHGTRHLEEAFGSNDSLDFFIMLSSVTSILGKTGQANYSVGNAYQDAFAQSRTTSKCKYISINLGAVDGSEAILALSLPQQEFMRQGSALMSFDEVFKVLEYSMGPQARTDGLVELILGFDRKSMEAVHDEFGLANPIFGQIPYLSEKEATSEQVNMDVARLLQQATTVEEIQSVVISAICERFALFTARSMDDINPNAPLEEFGIDSLVAIELKNWLVRTFQVSVQTSEVVDAPSISSLGKLVASRSELVSKDLGGKAREAAISEAIIKPAESTELIVNHSFHCCRRAKELPILPLNDFDIIFESYLKNTRMFQTDEEFQSILRDVAEFKAPGSIGRTFYNRLLEEANDPKIENWQDKYFLQSMYLQRRYPLAPFGNFMGFHALGKVQHTQAQRAALITSLAFQSKQDLEADRWEPMEYLGTPNCTDLWSYIFNTSRLPGEPLDSMVQFPAYDHVAVLHRGHIFKIDLKTGDEVLSFEQLIDIFQAILDRENTSDNWTTMLSADNRTKWTETREALIKLDKNNEDTINMVESAAFLVCLDETSPSEPEARVNELMMLDGFNRWVDKSLAFVVCKNAVSGTYVEHTMIDAMTLTKMQTSICNGIQAYDPSQQTNGHAKAPVEAPKEWTIRTTPEIEERIVKVRQRFLQDISKFGYRDIILNQFGSNYLLERGLPIKGIYDLMCQLANYYFYGYIARSWEAVSMSHYHKGRPDIVQVVTPVIAQFCTSAEDESVPFATRMQYMLDAAVDHNQTIKEALTGHAYQRTLRALELVAKPGEDIPALFKNPLYESTVEPDQMFSNTDGLSPQSCFIMGDPKKFWMTYFVMDEGAHISVITGKEEVKRWADALEKAADVMKTILDAVN